MTVRYSLSPPAAINVERRYHALPRCRAVALGGKRDAGHQTGARSPAGANSRRKRQGVKRPAARRFDNAGLTEPLRTLVDKVATQAHLVGDEDIASARASGLDEDQIFEIVVCAAIGQATRQHDAALAALDAACGKA